MRVYLRRVKERCCKIKFKLRDCTKVCQNCKYGNGDKVLSKYIHTWKRKDAEGENGFWHIWCELKEKYYPWDAIKLCYYKYNKESKWTWKHEIIESLDDIYQEFVKFHKSFREVYFPEEFDEEYKKQLKEGEEREEE